MARLIAATTFLIPLALVAACQRSPAPAVAAQSAAAVPTADTGAGTIRGEELAARIYFLASDALGGRNTPSPGLEAAAAYLASEHRRIGLEPAGESGTFFQRYPLTVRGGRPSGPGSVPQQATPPNVIGVIRGSDPQLRNEYVVLSAHFDHVGIGAPAGNDSIYNGADDNASGTSALLEIAEAFRSLPERPRRSIMFLHVSGEELGLLGSRWFSDHPTVPVASIVANFNVDMIGRNSPDSVVAIGKTYSSLGPVVDRTAAAHPELGLTVTDDLWPQERFFFRSDHFNFARLEIPALFFFAGEHQDYHMPGDEAEKIDSDKAARVARLIYYAVQAVANDPQRPTWDPRGLAEVRSMSR